MTFNKIYLDEIIPSDYNPRLMSQQESDKLSKNLEEFGLVDPIIINLKNNHIIAGHQRYNILREKYGNDVDYENKELQLIKLGDIGWVFEDTNLTIKDENHEKALNLALNKINGEWDIGKLTNIFQELQTQHFNLDLTGFNKTEIKPVKIELTPLQSKDTSRLEEEEHVVEHHETIITNPEDVDLDEYDTFNEDFDDDFFNENFDLDINSEEDEGEFLPDDFMEVKGRVENKNCSVILSFTSKDVANKFITQVLDCDKLLERDTVVLKHDKDFEYW